MRRKTRVDTGSRMAAAAALLTATLLSSGVAAAAAGGAPERLYVSDETGGDVVIVDPQRRSVVARIAVGKRPRGIQLSSDHQTLRSEERRVGKECRSRGPRESEKTKVE